MNTQQIVVKKNIANAINAGVMVAVVAWKTKDGGIGFDWFHSPSAADRVLEIQKDYDVEFRDVRRKSVRVDIVVTSYETAEQEINAHLEAIHHSAEEAIH